MSEGRKRAKVQRSSQVGWQTETAMHSTLYPDANSRPTMCMLYGLRQVTHPLVSPSIQRKEWSLHLLPDSQDGKNRLCEVCVPRKKYRTNIGCEYFLRSMHVRARGLICRL